MPATVVAVVITARRYIYCTYILYALARWVGHALFLSIVRRPFPEVFRSLARPRRPVTSASARHFRVRHRIATRTYPRHNFIRVDVAPPRSPAGLEFAVIVGNFPSNFIRTIILLLSPGSGFYNICTFPIKCSKMAE